MSVPKSKSIGRKRLMALADYVDKQRVKRSWRRFFNMGSWVTTMREHYKLKDGSVVEVNGGCGTSACLLGHGVNVPALKKAGLVAVYNERGSSVELAIEVNGHYTSQGRIQVICDKLFGVGVEPISDMFCRTPRMKKYDTAPLEKVTPADAVKNMRKVIAQIDANDGWTF